MDAFTGISNDELADQICTWAGRLAAGEARLLALIGEFDRREAWGGPGLLSCAHWLSWMTGLAPNAAREKVRVARALPRLPLLNEAFTAGKLSWSQVRAVTRVATPENEEDLLHAARHSTAAQLERITRGIRRVKRFEEARVDPREAAYRMRARCWYDADGDLVLSVRMAAEHGAVLLAAVEQARAQLDRRRLREAGAADVSAGTPPPLFGGFGEDRERLPLPPFRPAAGTVTAATAPEREVGGADEAAPATPGVSAETPAGGTGPDSPRPADPRPDPLAQPEPLVPAVPPSEMGTAGTDDASLLGGPGVSAETPLGGGGPGSRRPADPRPELLVHPDLLVHPELLLPVVPPSERGTAGTDDPSQFVDQGLSAETPLGGATGADAGPDGRGTPAEDEAEGRRGAGLPGSGDSSAAGDTGVSAETLPMLPAATVLADAPQGADAPQAAAGPQHAAAAQDAGQPPQADEPPRPASVADAVLEIARSFIAHQASARPDTVRRHRAALTIHIDPLSGWGRLRDGELLPPETLAAVQRTLAAAGVDPANLAGGGNSGGGASGILRPLTPADLTREDLGRSQRLPTLALRELLGTLDGERCRFPGCTRHRRLHAHHVRFWSDGGGTDLDNLLLLCGRHHTLVHAEGFRLALGPDRKLTVTTKDGTQVPHRRVLPWVDPAGLAAAGIDAATLPPHHIDPRIDLDYVVSVLVQQAA